MEEADEHPLFHLLDRLALDQIGTDPPVLLGRVDHVVVDETTARRLQQAVVDDDVQIGDQLTLLWGEPEKTGKTSTEPHRQAEIRVRVSPTPYAREAREHYADSWRTKSSA